MFYSEQVWEVAASLAIVGAIPWGAALYFSKRTHKPFFSQVAKPPFYPGYIAIHFVSLVVSLLYALAFYYVWANHGGWSGEPVALALVCGAQFLGVIGAFVTWVWFSPVSVMIGGAVTVLAGFAAIASAVWVFWAEALVILNDLHSEISIYLRGEYGYDILFDRIKNWWKEIRKNQN